MIEDSDAYAMQRAAQQGIATQGLGEVMADLRRQVVDVGWPVPERVRQRIPMITRFANERHIARVLRARVQAKALIQMHDTHRIDLAALAEDYVDIYTQYLVSLQGKGRKELVEIARWVQNPQQRRGLFSFMRP